MLQNITVNGVEYPTASNVISLDAVTAAVVAPVEPPAVWYQLPGGHTDAYDVVIEDSGRIHGYPAATWDACHLSFPDACVTPPRSNTDYAYFKVGSVRTAEGARVATGPLTLKGGHADGSLSAAKAMAFYDDTRSAFADVTIGEDQFGIWIAGGLRPDASPEAIRAAMASGFSGDWRWIGDGYELIALSAVNTPGFRRRVDVTENMGMVASMILDMPRGDPGDEVVVTTTSITETTRLVAAAMPDKAMPKKEMPKKAMPKKEMPETAPPKNMAGGMMDMADGMMGMADEMKNMAGGVAGGMIPEDMTGGMMSMADNMMGMADDMRNMADGMPADLPMPTTEQDAVLVSAALRIAKSIGRSPAQRIAALQTRVHPEPMEVPA